MNRGDMRFACFIVVCAACSCGYARSFQPNVKFLPNLMANATIRMNVEKPIGKWTGTGFLYVFRKHDDWTRCLYAVLTTRRFLQDAQSVSFSLPICGAEYSATGKRVAVAYRHEEMTIHYHPDTNVDLCALCIKPDKELFGGYGLPNSVAVLDSSLLADDAFYKDERQLDPVVMVGFPDGIEDDVNLQPIFRRGVYATNPMLDYKGKKDVLLDIPNHGGSAGSPVFRYDEGLYQNRAASCANLTIGSRLTLVGVSYDGSGLGVGQGPCVVLAGANNNMAWVLKASRIRELDDMLNEKYGNK